MTITALELNQRMKNLVSILLLLVMTCAVTSVKAQNGYSYYDGGNDGFFNPNSSNVLEYRNNEPIPGVDIPHLPKIGTDYNQKAPIGSGLLILTGLGLGYLTIKRKG